MTRIHIIGRKNCGKTTLIVELVSELTARGYRVGTIKHTHHRHELDTPGKDSHRHRQSGASVVGILSPNMNAVFWPPRPRQPDSARYDDLRDMFRACDVVLVEGDSAADAPRIEVWRAATGTQPLAATDGSINAVVTDDFLNIDLPVWARSNLSRVAEQLCSLLVRRDDSGPYATTREGTATGGALNMCVQERREPMKRYRRQAT